MLRKIDEQGNYTEYPGMTVIAMVKEEDRFFWQSLYSLITQDRELINYYSPLPVSSYHMTAINLFTEDMDSGGDWSGFLQQQQPLFKRLSTVLCTKAFEAKISIEAVLVSRTIQLCLNLPEEQHQIIAAIADEFQIKEKIPPVYHLTLAYQYKTPTQTEIELFKKSLARGLEQSLKAYSGFFFLKPAKLCSFKTMTAFIPWVDKELMG